MSLLNPGNFTNYSFSIVRNFYYIWERRMKFFYVYFLVVSVTFWQYTTILLKETLRKLHTFGKRYKQYLHQFSNGFTISHQFFKIGPGNKQASWAISLNMFYKIFDVDFSFFVRRAASEENKGLKDYKRKSSKQHTQNFIITAFEVIIWNLRSYLLGGFYFRLA